MVGFSLRMSIRIERIRSRLCKMEPSVTFLSLSLARCIRKFAANVTLYAIIADTRRAEWTGRTAFE